MRTAWTKANDQGADIDDRCFRAYIIKSMPSAWAPVTGTLFNLKTSADMIVRLTTHALLLHGPSVTAPAGSVHALSVQTTSNWNDKSHLKCKNPNCGWTGHMRDKYFRKGGGMEGQYLDWWRRNKGLTTNTMSSNTTSLNLNNTTPSTTNALQANSMIVTLSENDTNVKCFAFSIQTQAPSNGVTYADLAASRHFFKDKSDFVMYNPPSANNLVRVTAEGRTFQVDGCGQVCKWVQYGKEIIEVTFDNALHAPDLFHNLISLGCLVSKGVKVGLEHDGATMQTSDGTPFIKCAMEGVMFTVPFIQPPTALAT